MSIETLTINNVEVRFDFQRPITEQHHAILTKTLKLVPVANLRRLPLVVVGDRPPPSRGGAGGAVPSGQPDGPLIRINVRRFDEPHNRAFNQTLLHEIGHMMDYEYNCILGFYRRPENRPHLALLRHHARRYDGTTQGENEVYAVAYAGLIRHAPAILDLSLVDTQAVYVAVLLSPTFDSCRSQYTSFVRLEEVTFTDDDVVAGRPRGGARR
jgi:hypothetical protein